MSVFFAIIIAVSFSSCAKEEEDKEATAVKANDFLQDFLSDYNSMNTYLKDPGISISAFALDGAGLSSILRALYQSQSVTYAFTLPTEISKDVYSSNVTVVSLNMSDLKLMYDIDREISVMAGEELDEDYVAQAFYANIMEGTANPVTNSVPVIMRRSGDKWSLDVNNDLALAIFPNILYV